MTHIKNLRPTRALEGPISPAEMQDKDLPNKDLPNLHHLRILGSTVYVFLHEEERTLKSAKWDARALKGKLVGFDENTIYRFHIEDQNKVIRVKDLRIFEDTSTKAFSALPYFEGKPTFDGTPDEQGPSDKGSASEDEKTKSRPPQKSKKTRAGRDAQRTSEEENEPKTKRPKKTRAGTDAQRASEEENEPKTRPTKSRAGRTLKPSPKMQEEGESAVYALITKLTSLLEKDWEDDQVLASLTTCEGSNEDDDSNKADSFEADPLHILAAAINKANAGNPSDFSSSTQLDVEETETCERAMSGPHAQQWSHAIQEELEQLEKNETWILVPEQNIEPGHRPLSGKWVFKVKRDVNGAIARFRWVVRGYLQQFGIDFDQPFAAVVKPMAFRVLFAIAAYYDLDIDQMDVKTAFLYGLIDQLVYVQIPKGSEDATNKGKVRKLLKALYGLEQAPRLWYERLSKFLLEKLGLRRINAAHSIFVTVAGINRPIVSTFVDDIKVMGVKRSGHIDRVKLELAAAFEMVDMGPISFYLGLKVERDRQNKTLKLSQPAYIEKILAKYHLDQAKPCNTPMKEAILLPNEGPEASQADRERYQGMTGSLMFSMVETRPDIAFATSVVSRFAKSPS